MLRILCNFDDDDDFVFTSMMKMMVMLLCYNDDDYNEMMILCLQLGKSSKEVKKGSHIEFSFWER